MLIQQIIVVFPEKNLVYLEATINDKLAELNCIFFMLLHQMEVLQNAK